jgi:hypothetical protein
MRCDASPDYRRAFVGRLGVSPGVAGGQPGSSGQSSVSTWVASQCTVVAGLSSASASSGADGFAPGPGGSQGTLNLEAAFQQIQAAMTADQLQAIQSMDLSGQDTLALAQKLGIAMPAGQATLTPEQQATMEAGGFDAIFYQAVINLLQQKTQ